MLFRRILLSCLFLISLNAFSQVDLQNLNAEQKGMLNEVGKDLSDSELEKLKRMGKNFDAGQDLQKSDQPASEEGDNVDAEVKEGEEQEGMEEMEEENLEIFNEVYGKNIINSGKLDVFQNSDRFEADDSYVMGPGDELTISIWGYSEFHNSYTIGQNGSIFPKMVGKINLNGLTFKRARGILKSRFGKYYDLKNSHFDVHLNRSKVISVNIVGEVEKPGTYTFPAINSAFNVLSLAGGITELGSIREIQIKRNGRVVKTLDFYAFLLNPNASLDAFLLNNDFIVVSVRKNIVKACGAINRQGMYEIREGEGLMDLIEFAGGMHATCYKKNMHQIRIEEDEKRYYDIPLEKIANKEMGDILVRDGDEFEFLAVPEIIRGAVEIKGAVSIPGKYQYKSGDRILDLVKRAGGLTRHSYLKNVSVMRTNEDFSTEYYTVDMEAVLNGDEKENIELKENDLVQVLDNTDFQDSVYVSVKGAVRQEVDIPFYRGITLKDVLYLSGGVLNEADLSRVEISQVDLNDDPSTLTKGTRTVIKSFQVPADLEEEFAENPELKPFDQIFVRYRPDYSLQRNVEVVGEVMYPGVYSLSNRGETIRELIERAGGLTEWAAPERASITRAQSDNGHVILDLEALFVKKQNEFNYILKEGDKIVIPGLNDLVMIQGEVEYPNISELGKVHVPFKGKKSARYYINKYASGFNKYAHRKSTYVVSEGGYVKRTKSFLFIRYYPRVSKGDKVVVEKKEKRKKKENKEEVDWNKAIESTTVKISGLLTIWLLVNNVFKN